MSSTWSSRLIRCVLMLGCALGVGCAVGPVAKDATKSTVRGAYEEIDGLDDGLRERVVKKLVDSPAVHAATEDLMASAVRGTVDGFTQAEADGKINALVDAALSEMRTQGDAAMKEMLGHFQRELTPVLRALIRELVASTSAAFREAATKDLPVITSAIIDSTMRAFAIAASTATQQLRAQARGFAEDDLAPFAGVISERVAHDAVIGIREGLHKDLNLEDPVLQNEVRQIGMGFAQGVAQGTPVSPFATGFATATLILSMILLICIGAIISLWSRQRLSMNLISRIAEHHEDHGTAEGLGAARPSRA